MNLSILKESLTDLLLVPRAAAERLRLRHDNARATGYIGWVRHSNLGDEAMFQAASQGLWPHRALPLLPSLTERLLQATGLSGPSLFEAVVLGGGTLINRFYLDLARQALSWKIPLCVAGTGVGSPGFGFAFEREKDLENWREILQKVPLLGVRGPRSERLLREIGASHVEVIGDPALSFTPNTLPPLRTRPRLVINLGPDRSAPAAGVGLIATEFAKAGGEVLGVALGAGDGRCLENFRARYGLREMTIESHRESGDGLMAALAGSQALVTVRLHGAVLASCAGVPSVLFAYRSKCFDFMESVKLERFAVPLTTAEDGPALQALLREIASTPQLRESIHANALTWKRKQSFFFSQINALVAGGK